MGKTGSHDLRRIAHDAMLQRGMLPDFSADVLRETQAILIHPFDDARVIAGQGTAALELLDDVPDLDIVIAPVGGGGLLSGTSIAVRSSRPGIRVYGAEPVNADDASRSFRTVWFEPLPASSPRRRCARYSPAHLSAIRATSTPSERERGPIVPHSTDLER